MKYRALRSCTDFRHHYHSKGDVVEFFEGETVPPHFESLEPEQTETETEDPGEEVLEPEPVPMLDLDQMSRDELMEYAKKLGVKTHHKHSEETLRNNINEFFEKA